MNQHETYPDVHHDTYSRTVFGFWLYLLTDLVLFGSLFAAYAVLHANTFGGPSAKDLFNVHCALFQTLILLASSFTAGLAGALAHRRNKNGTIILFTLTFLLGLAFIIMEGAEFYRFLELGAHWKRSAFLSAYFTVVGTHGVHILFGLLWIPILLFPALKEGISYVTLRRLTCLKMFWQFLNVIWIFIFSFIYLIGVI